MEIDILARTLNTFYGIDQFVCVTEISENPCANFHIFCKLPFFVICDALVLSLLNQLYICWMKEGKRISKAFEIDVEKAVETH